MAKVFPAHQCIVVGGGLAGFSAAHTILEYGGRAVVLDKSPFCGGNSTKATSGINGSGTSSQKAKGIKDDADIFLSDTLKGGAKKPEVAKVMCVESGPGVEWLIEKFDLDLSLVARLGGHSQPRTHRGAERFPGMTITYALMQRFEKIAETSDRARIVNKARVFNLLTDGPKQVIGAEYEKAGMAYNEYGPVILCSGGFGADFGSDSLLAKYRPDLLHLPTTNGEHCTGDGIKMGERINAKTIDLEWVQVHPTGLVKIDDADAKVKFLAAEALRGVGGVLIDKTGNRFCNELGRRDYVSGMMWKNQPPFRLCLNSKASKEIHWHCEHYKGRGVMKGYKNMQELCDETGIKPDVLRKTLDDHSEIGKKVEANLTRAPTMRTRRASRSTRGARSSSTTCRPRSMTRTASRSSRRPSTTAWVGWRSTRRVRSRAPRAVRSVVCTRRARSRAVCTATTASAATRCSTAWSSAA